MNFNKIVQQVKSHVNFHKVGMVLYHNGVVRNTSRNGLKVLCLKVVVDHELLHQVIEKYKKSIYDKKPNLGGISSTPDGNILVSGIWSEGEETNYWLLDEGGKTLAQISLDSLMLRISKHFILLRTIDDEENYLNICLKRRGTEKEDLLRIKDLKILE